LDKALLNGVVMDVVQGLLGGFWGVEFYRVVVLLPKLECFVSAVFLACPFHHPQKPIPSAFFLVLLNGFSDGSGCEALQIPDYIGKDSVFCSDYQMYVASHDTETIYF
jgi:hypothetical protein